MGGDHPLWPMGRLRHTATAPRRQMTPCTPPNPSHWLRILPALNDLHVHGASAANPAKHKIEAYTGMHARSKGLLVMLDPTWCADAGCKPHGSVVHAMVQRQAGVHSLYACAQACASARLAWIDALKAQETPHPKSEQSESEAKLQRAKLPRKQGLSSMSDLCFARAPFGWRAPLDAPEHGLVLLDLGSNICAAA